MSRCHPWAWILGAGALLLLVCDARACNVPVFRYALERWFPDPYEAIIFHRGPLSESDQRLVAWLEHYGDKEMPAPEDTKADPRTANIVVRTCDTTPLLYSAPAWAGPFQKAALAILNQQSRAPWLVVRYPRSANIGREAWSGPLAAAAARKLLDSPLRRELARRLMAGESAVWILIESGDKALDDSAHRLLEKQLPRLEKTLELPKLTPSPRDKLLFADGPKLRIAFSILRVARTDADEAALVRMLLGMEDDLWARNEPVVFPVFGRGLALYALVGKGINQDNVAETAAFIIGACSCEAKKQNPGVDMLLTEDWEGGLSGRLTRMPLLGLVDTLPPQAPSTPPTAAVAAIGNKRLLEGVVLAVIGGAIVLTLIGSFFRGKPQARG
jgi:hypothetical protein